MIANIVSQLLLEQEVTENKSLVIQFVRKAQVCSLLSCIAEISDFSVDEINQAMETEFKLLSEEYLKSLRVDVGDSILNSVLYEKDNKSNI